MTNSSFIKIWKKPTIFSFLSKKRQIKRRIPVLSKFDKTSIFNFCPKNYKFNVEFQFCQNWKLNDEFQSRKKSAPPRVFSAPCRCRDARYRALRQRQGASGLLCRYNMRGHGKEVRDRAYSGRPVVVAMRDRARFCALAHCDNNSALRFKIWKNDDFQFLWKFEIKRRIPVLSKFEKTTISNFCQNWKLNDEFQSRRESARSCVLWAPCRCCNARSRTFLRSSALRQQQGASVQNLKKRRFPIFVKIGN